MYRQDFHLQTLTCLAIAISPLCKLVPHWFGFCVRFLKNFNSLQTWSFICCNSWTNTDVHTARPSDLGHCIRRNLPSWFERAQKSHASFNSIFVVTNPNFFAWISTAVMYRQNFHLQTLTVFGPAISSFYKLVSHSCGKACRNVWLFPIIQACFTPHVAKPAETFGVRSEVKESEVRHLWHCQIWQWPRWTIV